MELSYICQPTEQVANECTLLKKNKTEEKDCGEQKLPMISMNKTNESFPTEATHRW